jgi:uncharacterized protein YjeT (DUF2065 family)
MNGFATGFMGMALAAVVVLAGLFLLFRPRRGGARRYSATPSSLPGARRDLLDESLLDDDPLFRETPVRRAERR